MGRLGNTKLLFLFATVLNDAGTLFSNAHYGTFLRPGHRPHYQTSMLGFTPEGRFLSCSLRYTAEACFACDPDYFDDSTDTTTAPSTRCDAQMCTPLRNVFPPPTPLEALNFAGPIVLWEFDDGGSTHLFL